jgi:hypothetical protein
MEDRGVSDIVYLYGFVPPDAPAPPASLTGVGGAEVRLANLGRLQAVVSHLPEAEYDGATIEARLQDMAWVGEQGLAHERVVLWFVDHVQILPARLFSLYSGDAALAGSLAAAMDTLVERLQRLADRREWNLKVAYDAAEVARHGAEVSEQVRSIDADIEAAPPGRRYLLQRRRADLLRDEIGVAARRLADELFNRMRAEADEVRTLPLAAADQAAGSVVLNAALLVSRTREDSLKAVAEAEVPRLRELGIIASFSGPWAAYRFVEEATDG